MKKIVFYDWTVYLNTLRILSFEVKLAVDMKKKTSLLKRLCECTKFPISIRIFLVNLSNKTIINQIILYKIIKQIVFINNYLYL